MHCDCELLQQKVDLSKFTDELKFPLLHPKEFALQSTVSVIVPVRNEHPEVLEKLAALLDCDGILEVIIVDSSDQQPTLETLNWLQKSYPKFRLIHSNGIGRAVQMNLGEQHAQGSIAWFVHADTTVPNNAANIIKQSISPAQPWGRFDVRFNSSSPLMQLVASTMNIRSAMSGICTGDQAIFVERDIFQCIGGYPEIAIMEDVALSKRLKEIGRAVRVRTPVTTSARRWETSGFLQTIVQMWAMRTLFWIGVSPRKLARLYRQVY